MIFHSLDLLLEKCEVLRVENEKFQVLPLNAPIPEPINPDVNKYKVACIEFMESLDTPNQSAYIYVVVSDRAQLDAWVKRTLDKRVKSICYYYNLIVFPYQSKFLFSCDWEHFLGVTPAFCIANSPTEAWKCMDRLYPEAKISSVHVVKALDLSGDYPKIALYNKLGYDY